MANNATIGGHVTIGDFAILGGLSAVHQFVRIGAHAMIGGMSGVENDVIPYGSVTGERAHLSGLNIIGLKRRGFRREDVHALRTAYRLFFGEAGTMAERTADVAEQFPDNKAVMDVVEFIRSDSSRAVCQPKSGRGAA
jgi:UDP-N-acetylglucosamine acyltransferase